MVPMSVVLLAEGEFQDPDNIGLGDIPRIGRLPNGTQSGKATVVVEIKTPDGEIVLGQTTLYLLATAVKSMLIAEKRDGVEYDV